MPVLASTIRSLGGVATTTELVERGIHPKSLAAAVHDGSLLRVRRGWYALPNVDPAIRAAVRIGGRLACVSAAAHHGWATPPRSALHVSVAPNAGRLRPAPPEYARRSPVLHWRTTFEADGPRSRLVTSPFETIRQMVGCAPAEQVVAALDSFLRSDPAQSIDLERWLGGLPRAVLDRLPERSRACESYLETIGRIRLAAVGIRGEHQVEFPGIGRVDLVIDDRVVVEWDGGHHRTAEQQNEDCRRDAYLATLGYRVLRFSYHLVMNEWFVVVAAIRAALDEVGCRH